MHALPEPIRSAATLKISGIASAEVMQIRGGALDANGQKAIQQKADGGRNPCRHCLQLIQAGSPMLVLAYRPFAHLQPYAELGPVFLHQQSCPRYQQPHFPTWFDYMDPALVRGYDSNDWICYETGAVLAGRDLARHSADILANPNVSYVHVRSKFNCFQCRVDRG